jgi:cytochrome c553
MARRQRGPPAFNNDVAMERDLPGQLLRQMRACAARRRGGRARCAAALALVAGLACSEAARAQPTADRFALCAGCHGEGGVSSTTEVPTLAGQPSFYAITQLFLFRQGRRANPLMTAIAKDMTDADLRFFSELIGRLPAAPLARSITPADPARMARGAALTARYRCTSCHGNDLAGGAQVARLAGQREDYLVRTLADFRAGRRIGYTQAMNEALAGIGPAELDDLAHYLAYFSSADVAVPAAAASRP